MTQMKTEDEVLRLVEQLEAYIKICGCFADDKYYMLGKIDRIHATIYRAECKHTDAKDDSIHTEIIKEYEKAKCYKTWNEIIEEFRGKFGMSPIEDIKHENDDTLKVRVSQYDFNDGPETIPATLKDVCEWWIKTYPEHVFFNKPISVIEIRKYMKMILNDMK